ncbi:hypothetical protein [Streptomyces sp. NPDC093094]|uniref:hypothetical protein n=1 Tax=Streptomyces sp. NPDC093094 TaxID=3366026 RepID=UPI00381EE500
MLKDFRARRTVIASAFGVLLAGSFSLNVAAPATASAAERGRPTGCSYELINPRLTVAECDRANGGHYRAVANCRDTDTGAIKVFEGDWRNNGSFSKAYCQGSTKAVSAGIETKTS